MINISSNPLSSILYDYVSLDLPNCLSSSFLFRYQHLNNGKFPSLNLTHKEVGGSFYTVREIVRDIIQQNRVLGPGNSTSKTLNLEYCTEELAGESFSADNSGLLSLSTMNHAADQTQGETFSFSSEHNITSQGLIEVDESIKKERLVSHSIDDFFSQAPEVEQYHGISNGAYPNGNLENLSYKGLNHSKLPGETNENLVVCDQGHTGVNIHIPDDPEQDEDLFTSYDTHPMTPFRSVSLTNGGDDGNKSSNTTVEINSSGTSSSHPPSRSVPETTILSDSVPDGAFSHYEEESPALSPGAKTDKFQKTVHKTCHEIPKTSESDEMRVAFVPFEKDPVINSSQKTETIKSAEVDEVSAASPSRQPLLEKDFSIDRSETEIPPSIAVNEVSIGSLNGSVPHNESSTLPPAVSFSATTCHIVGVKFISCMLCGSYPCKDYSSAYHSDDKR